MPMGVKWRPTIPLGTLKTKEQPRRSMKRMQCPIQKALDPLLSDRHIFFISCLNDPKDMGAPTRAL